MTPKSIRLMLTSAATFGRGDGLAGLVDREIEHDAHGLPFLRGKTLKGLLLESAENVVFALEGWQGGKWQTAKQTLFGRPGRGTDERGSLHIGDARLPETLRAQVINAGLSKADALFSLTGIRRQTAMNPDGGPAHASLRSMRVLLPGVVLVAELHFDLDPDETQLQLLTAAVLDMRRGGTGRNRGRGHFQAVLDDEDSTKKLFAQFAKAVGA
jgi:hypothetical protein